MNLTQLVRFSGRLGRRDFWLIQLTGYVLLVAVAQLEAVVGIVIPLILFAPIFLVGLATSIKRWHDRGKSGWWVFVNAIPLVGVFWALIEQGFFPGTDGDNQYGFPGSGSPFSGVGFIAWDARPPHARL